VRSSLGCSGGCDDLFASHHALLDFSIIDLALLVVAANAREACRFLALIAGPTFVQRVCLRQSA
jgi:hypothetical protein